MIELHCHLLPAVDDGARTAERAAEVLRAWAAQGVTDVCLTPHVLAGEMERGVSPRHEAAFTALAALAPAVPRLHRGAEVMLDRPLAAGAAAQAGFRLGGGPWLLVEFPRLVSADAVSQALRHAVELGVRPLLAHPERYGCCAPALVARWRELGAAMQVDATTCLLATRRGERARQLLAYGLADVAASDNHGDDRSLAALRDALTAQGAGDVADLLLRANPEAILAGQALAPVPPVRIHRSLGDRLRQLFSGTE